MSFGEDFRYSVLCEELVVGEVYVRVYNDQPTYVLEVSCRTDSFCLHSCECGSHSVYSYSSEYTVTVTDTNYSTGC